MLLAVYAPIDDNASDDDDDDDGGDALWHSSKTRRRMYCVKRGWYTSTPSSYEKSKSAKYERTSASSYKLYTGSVTAAALVENNEASAKLTTANGGTFTWAQLDSVANHVTARSIGVWRALTWLATATGWTRRKRSAICSGKLSVSTWFDTTWIGGTASRLYTCKSVCIVRRLATNKADYIIYH